MLRLPLQPKHRIQCDSDIDKIFEVAESEGYILADSGEAEGDSVFDHSGWQNIHVFINYI